MIPPKVICIDGFSLVTNMQHSLMAQEADRDCNAFAEQSYIAPTTRIAHAHMRASNYARIAAEDYRRLVAESLDGKYDL